LFLGTPVKGRIAMSILGLRLPIDIPWERIGVSVHMMDKDVCDRIRPAAMQPSVAVFEYEPDEALENGDRAFKISYLKITCSVTSYGATNLDKLRRGRRIVSSPYSEFVFSGSSYDTKKSDEFNSSHQLSGADLPCFGALLEVSVGPGSGDWSIEKYPYFSDFDPKKRELYELVSETGEVMSRTLEHTGVLHGGTTSTSNEVFDKDTWGVKGGGSVGNEKVNVKAEGSYASEEGSRNIDSATYANVRTVDAGREARETYSHTTQLSQMYQLLTSFHLGTNRAVFFFEPRPHIVQRERSFIDGPRQLEGIQEFFLVVVRPREMQSICVNASLETLHVGTTLDASDSNAEKTATLHLPRLGRDGGWPDPDHDETFVAENTVTYPAPPGWVIDQFKEAGGYRIDKLDRKGNANHKIEVTSTTVSIWGRVEEQHIEGDLFEKDRRDSGYLEVAITIYLKPAVTPPARTKQFAILTNTSVCTCPQRGMYRPAPGPSIVREIQLPTAERPIGRPMPVETAHDWSKFFSQAVRSSMSSPDRYPTGAVGFWDLDVMKEPLADLTRGKNLAGTTVGGLLSRSGSSNSGLDEATQAFLARPEVAEKPAADLLRPKLRDFVEASGLDFHQAAALRRVLWEEISASPPTDLSLPKQTASQ
jgi:hypothetical protein